jgi:hypothetical protein
MTNKNKHVLLDGHLILKLKFSAEIYIRFIDEVLIEVNIKLVESIKMSKHYNHPFLSDEKFTRLN